MPDDTVDRDAGVGAVADIGDVADVAVIGGGIAGLASAISLRRAGRQVVVVERAKKIANAGSGLVLYPNGVAALEAVSSGLERSVRESGHVPMPRETRPLVTASGTVLSSDPVGELAARFGKPQVCLLRSRLQHALLAELSDVDLRVGVSAVSHVDHGDRVDVALSSGESISARAVIGADGVGSGVRARLLGDGDPVYRGYTSLRGRSSVPPRYPHGFTATGPGIDFFVAPVGEGQVYWTAKIVAPQGRWPSRGPAAALDDLLCELDGWHGPIVDMVRETSRHGEVIVTDIVDRDPVANWAAGRVALIGDAIHPMSPAMGQGASIALEDSVVLAHHLTSRADVEEALVAYGAARASRAASVVLQSRSKGGVDNEALVTTTEAHDLAARAANEFSTEDEQLAGLFGWRPPPQPEEERRP